MQTCQEAVNLKTQIVQKKGNIIFMFGYAMENIKHEIMSVDGWSSMLV